MAQQPLLGESYVNIKDEPIERLRAVESMEEAEEGQVAPAPIVDEDEFLVANKTDKMQSPWHAAAQAVRHPVRTRGSRCCYLLTMLLATGTLITLVGVFFARSHFFSSGDSGPQPLFPPPVSVPFDRRLQYGSMPLPLNDERVTKSVGGFLPEQVHITYVAEDAVYVTWVTGDAQIGPIVQPWNVGCVRSLVEIGEAANNYAMLLTGMSEIYNQTHTFPGGLNYTSGIIHHVKVEGLKPETTYFYRVGDPDFGFSYEMSFRTLKATGPKSFPIRLGLIGDLGETYNSTSTIAHLEASDPASIMLVGDFTYADQHLTNDTLAPSLLGFPIKTPPQTYQPRWDMWARLMEPLLSTKPFISNNGNHEIELQSDNTTFASYNARYPVPHNESNSTSNLYYSFDLGGMHVIMLTPYAPYDPESDQYRWLVADLETVDRSVTPWLVVSIHAPWYNTYVSHYKENECMRFAIEQLLYEAGTDLVLTGHVHAYERTNPVYDYVPNLCGPVHITIGDGGNVEGIETRWVDEPGQCPDPNRPGPFYAPMQCPSFQDDDGGYCPSKQPIWSAYREPSFGHGVLEVVNSTHAHWQWHRNQDGYARVSDDAWIDRRVQICPNKR